MPNPGTPILRSAYRPLAYTVDTVDLDFSLDAEATQVTNRMRCVRNLDAAAGPVVLFGDGLELVSLTVDGVAPPAGALRQTGTGFELDVDADELVLEIVTRINPSANLTLSGLYRSRGGFYTQCEAEGFRRITYFPDRPDVMARYTVRLEADAATCPVLLSNGNLLETGTLPGGRHFARWEDPFPKPSYLFALVAADLKALERRVEVADGDDGHEIGAIPVLVEPHDGVARRLLDDLRLADRDALPVARPEDDVVVADGEQENFFAGEGIEQQKVLQHVLADFGIRAELA